MVAEPCDAHPSHARPLVGRAALSAPLFPASGPGGCLRQREAVGQQEVMELGRHQS